MSRKKSRVHSLEFKNAVLDEIERGDLTHTQALKKYRLSSSVLCNWKNRRTAGTLTASNVRVGSFNTTSKKGISDEAKQAALAELAAGGKAKAIAKRLGVSDAALYWWRKKANGNEYPSTTARRKGNGKGGAVVVVGAPVDTSERIGVLQQQSAMRDATIFLRKAKHELLDGIRAGNIDDLDSSHLLSLLALKALQGGV